MSGTFDLQVNGYGGVDFNQDRLTPEQLHQACLALAHDGVEGILATIITEKLDVMVAKLRRLVELCERDELARKLLVGFHIEGPFINEASGYRGAHPADAIVSATREAATRLVEAGGGRVRLVTLAPERDAKFAVTRFLHQQGICVSAGHCDASLDELKAAIDAGLSMFTHLGNGCPLQMHRHDNIVQRVLGLSEQLWLCFIADGAHIPFFALGNYLRLATIERCIIVTDAIAPASLGPGFYTLGRWQLQIGDDMVARAADGSHLIGAAITMPQSIANLKTHLVLSEDTIHRLTTFNPRKALGLP